MSQFNDRVRDSAAFSNLKQTEELLDELSERDWQHQTTKDFINRMVVVVKHVLGRMTIADRNLVTESSLNQLEHPSYYLLDYVNNLSSYTDDQEPDIHNGSGWADQVLDAAQNLPVFPVHTTDEVIQRVSDQFEREMKSKAASLNEQLDKTQGRASTVFKLVNQAEATSNELLERNRAATEHWERQVTSTQEVFRESQRQREEVFENSEKTRATEFQKNLDPIVTEVKGYRDQAKSMLHEVAGRSTAEHYKEARNKQEKSTRNWRIVGVIALIGLVVASGFVFYDAQINQNEFSWPSLVGRSGLLLSLSALATYALKQAGVHRRQAEEISRVANELILLWPFIDRMTEQDREEILRQLAPLYFRGGLTHNNVDDQVGLIDSAIDRMTRRNNAG